MPKATQRRTTPAPASDAAEVRGYRRISVDRAGLIGHLIASSLQDEELTHAFCELLEGLTAASFESRPSVESLALIAAWRAYANTVHFSEAFEHFKRLPPPAPEGCERGGREEGSP